MGGVLRWGGVGGSNENKSVCDPMGTPGPDGHFLEEVGAGRRARCRLVRLALGDRAGGPEKTGGL